MLELGIVKGDENSNGRDFEKEMNFVNEERFMNILRSDIGEDKIKIPKNVK